MSCLSCTLIEILPDMTQRIRHSPLLAVAATVALVHSVTTAFVVSAPINLAASRSSSSTVVQVKSLLDFIPNTPQLSSSRGSSQLVQDFAEAWSSEDIPSIVKFLAENGTFCDVTNHYEPLEKADFERYLYFRLLDSKISLLGTVKDKNKAGILFETDGRKGLLRLQLDDDSGIIQNLEYIVEANRKSGENGLRVLNVASKILNSNVNPISDIPVGVENGVSSVNTPPRRQAMTPPERYFDAWNRRDMQLAVDVFTEEIEYDDTAFSAPFRGKALLKEHLELCSSCFPDSFRFQVDDILQQDNKLVVAWHVENNNEKLPFTKGLSYYTAKNNRIQSALDFIDSEPIKTEWVGRYLKKLVASQPVRLIPAVLWVLYMYIVFFSDGILPGANALQVEQRTWEEVRDLSLNFFLVAPTLSLPFSPVVHPLLEAVFNLLLSWAALFAGFLSDERRTKPNLVPMLPTVVGMQFLTSAFLLPFLATRSTETATSVKKSQVPFLAESRWLYPALSGVGLYSIYWGLFARPEFADRWTSFVDLLSIDRVGSSFLVDLAIFAVFQGWLVDEDLQRRGVDSDEYLALRQVAKCVPFFGMAIYLALRPSLEDE